MVNLLLTSDVQGYVLAGVVLAMRGARHQGGNLKYLAGVLSQAEHTCLAVQGDWPALLGQARGLLGAGQRDLLDEVLRLETHAPAR